MGAAQDKTKPESEYDVRKCEPRVTSHAPHRKPPEIHVRKGEKYTNSPVVAYQILESGEIAHAFVKRRSGVADADKYALASVQEFKYNTRPGCGVVESQAVVTIDFTGVNE